MFCFKILRIFRERLQKSKTGNLSISGSYAVARPMCQNSTPRVRHGVALLLLGKGLHRSVATIHRGPNFGFLF